MMSSLEIDVDSEHETPKEHVRSFLQVRFNVMPLLRRFAFASLIISTIKLKIMLYQNQRSHRVSKGRIESR